MSNRFYLIQRGRFRNPIENATSFLSGKSDALIDPDYMGAAEFEWGAIPKAFRRILSQYDKYRMHVTDLVTTGGVPLCLYCNTLHYEEILAAIKTYINEEYCLKEWSNMACHFKPLPENAGEWSKNHRKYELQTNFWWCIDKARDDFHIGDWIAFTGAADRQHRFIEVLDHDYNEWWLKKSEEERKEELEKSIY